MIGVEPGGRRWRTGSPAQFGRGGDVDKAAGRIAPQEADAARTEDQRGQHVRRCRSRRPALPSLRPPQCCRASRQSRRRSGRRCFSRCRTPVRLPSARSRSPSPSRSNAATRPASGSAGGGCGLHTRRGIRERHVRHSGVDERCLGSRRGDGLGVAALLEVGLRVGDRVAALAQLLEAGHRGAAFVCTARRGSRCWPGRRRPLRCTARPPSRAETHRWPPGNRRSCRYSWPRLMAVPASSRIHDLHPSRTLRVLHRFARRHGR